MYPPRSCTAGYSRCTADVPRTIYRIPVIIVLTAIVPTLPDSDVLPCRHARIGSGWRREEEMNNMKTSAAAAKSSKKRASAKHHDSVSSQCDMAATSAKAKISAKAASAPDVLLPRRKQAYRRKASKISGSGVAHDVMAKRRRENGRNISISVAWRSKRNKAHQCRRSNSSIKQHRNNNNMATAASIA